MLSVNIRLNLLEINILREFWNIGPLGQSVGPDKERQTEDQHSV